MKMLKWVNSALGGLERIENNEPYQTHNCNQTFRISSLSRMLQLFCTRNSDETIDGLT